MDSAILLNLLFAIPGVILATTLHEFTKAWVSTLQGDTVPRNQGRVTLNPIKHFEPIGFILMLVTGGFGWGKPVETSALHYKNRKKCTLITGVVPLLANLLMGLICMLLYKLTNGVLAVLFANAVRLNVAIAVFNIVPIPPMDGVKILSVLLPSDKYFKYMQYEKILQVGFLILLFMGMFSAVFDRIINLIVNLFDMLLIFI